MSERPFSTRATRALALADSEADALNDPFIGTEHLLLGLLAEKTGPAAQILGLLGVTPRQVHEILRRARSPHPPEGGLLDQPSNDR